MKKMKLAVLAITLIGIFGAGNVLAATDSSQITVSAAISASCAITGTTNIAFGAIDPLTTNGDLDSIDYTPGSVTVACTTGTNIDFSTDAILDMTSTINPGTPIAYTPVVPATTETPGITGATYDINATIAESEYKNAAAANDYSGTFNVVITY